MATSNYTLQLLQLAEAADAVRSSRSFWLGGFELAVLILALPLNFFLCMKGDKICENFKDMMKFLRWNTYVFCVCSVIIKAMTSSFHFLDSFGACYCFRFLLDCTKYYYHLFQIAMMLTLFANHFLSFYRNFRFNAPATGFLVSLLSVYNAASIRQNIEFNLITCDSFLYIKSSHYRSFIAMNICSIVMFVALHVFQCWDKKKPGYHLFLYRHYYHKAMRTNMQLYFPNFLAFLACFSFYDICSLYYLEDATELSRLVSFMGPTIFTVALPILTFITFRSQENSRRPMSVEEYRQQLQNKKGCYDWCYESNTRVFQRVNRIGGELVEVTASAAGVNPVDDTGFWSLPE